MRVIFFISAMAVAIMSSAATDCTPKLSQSICLIKNLKLGSLPKTCDGSLAGKPASEYTDMLVSIYEASPAQMRELICSMKRLYVVEKVNGGAAPSSFSVNVLSLTGFRADVFARPDLGWNIKRQLNLYFSRPEPDLDLHYNIIAETSIDALKGVAGVIFTHWAHELGHILELRNLPEECSYSECGILAGTFGEMNWSDFDLLKDAQMQAMSDELCFTMFNDCQNKSVVDPLDFFTRLETTNFVTPFAMSTSHEDFADSFEYLMLSKVYDSVTMTDTTGASFEMLLRLKDPANPFAVKAQFLENLATQP